MKPMLSTICTGLLSCLAATTALAGQQLQTPDVQTTIDDTLRWPWTVAVDASGDVFAPDRFYGIVRIYKPSGGAYTSVVATTGDHALDTPRSIAIDADGHLFVGEASVVTRLDAQAEDSYDAVASIGQDVVAHPYGVAVASSGDVFVADTDNWLVRRFTPDTSGAYIEQATVADGKIYYDVTVDASRNVFAADTFAHQIKVFRWNGTGYPAIPDTVLDIGSGTLHSVALDRYGNVYAVDHDGKRVVKFAADGEDGYSSPQLLASVGEGTTYYPHYVTVDDMLNVYVVLTDAYSGRIIKIGDRIFADGME